MHKHLIVGWAAASLLGPAFGLLQLSPAEASGRSFRCHGAIATIVGTRGDDVLVGTPGRDVIVGRAGDDRIRGRGGNDVICGNVGADVLEGGPGRDRLYGGTGVGKGREGDAGDDVWDGDMLEGGPGADHLDLGDEDNPYYPSLTQHLWERISFARSQRGIDVDLAAGTARGQGRDTVVSDQLLMVIGTRHNDTIRAGKHTLCFYGGAGDDRAIGGRGPDCLHPGAAANRNTRRGLPGNIGVGGRDAAFGRAGADSITSGQGGGRDTLRGGPGADYLVYEGSAAVHLDAGTGSDTVYVELPDRDGSHVSTGPVSDAGDRLNVGLPRVKTIDWDMVTGSFLLDGEDREIHVAASPRTWLDRTETRIRSTISGTDLGEYVLVTSGSTTFYGRGGDDTLHGHFYDDFFDGGDGDDTFEGDFGGHNTCISVEHDPLDACAP